MTPLRRLLLTALALALAALALFAAGMAVGAARTEATHAKEQRDQARGVASAYAAGVRAGAADVAALQQKLQAQHAYATQLQEKQAHVPLTVSRASACPPARSPIGAAVAVVADEDGAVRDADAVRLPAALDRADVRAPPGADGGADRGLELTLGAISLWNSALAGADVPAGACGAPGAPDPACAAGATIFFDDVWRNHGVNAAICAADRTRHQRLIDHINKQPRAAR